MPQNNASNDFFDVRAFSSDEKRAIIITPLFIVNGSEKSKLAEIISSIKDDPKGFKASDDLTVIYLDKIDNMDYRNDKFKLDIRYIFKGESNDSILNFENNEDFKEFIDIFNDYTENSFRADTRQCSKRERAAYPLCAALIVAILGVLLTYVVNFYHNYKFDRTMAVKAYVHYFFTFCKLTGPYPVAIVCIILFVLCVTWLIRIFNNTVMETIFERNKR